MTDTASGDEITTVDPHEDDTLLEEIRAAVANRQVDRARDLANRMLEEDALALLEDLTPAELSQLFAFLGDETLALLLSRLDDRDAASILTRMSAAQAADILEEIAPDDATDIFAEVESADPEAAGTIMIEMDPDDAAEIRDLMAYDPETAGGIMTPEFVAVFPELRADETVTALRRVAAETPHVHYVYVIDRDDRLIGVLSLHSLVLSRPDTPVRDLMAPNTWAIEVDEDQEVAARVMTERDLLALPVIDHDGRLLGIITHDDIADIIEEEATEDIERLGGSQPLETPYRRAGIMLLFRKRIPWLLALFIAEAYTGSVLRLFEDELGQVVALSFFIPLLIGTGGNVGSQITTTLVRAMAVEDLTLKDLRWIISKEVIVGVVIGLIMAVIAFIRAELLHVGPDVATVVALTISAICIWSSFVAAMLPMAVRKFRFDPTVVSAPFITTLVDGTGLVIYFTIAKLVLNL